MAGRGSGTACFVEGGSRCVCRDSGFGTRGWQERSNPESRIPNRAQEQGNVVVDRAGQRPRSQVRFYERRDPAKAATVSAGRGGDVFPPRGAARRAGRSPLKI